MLLEHTVLAVDDEPANRRAVCRTLGDECRVRTAASGREALELMAREPVALVIADQRMPGMSGAEFLAETVERYPPVIRIVLTGYTDVDTLLEAINRGHVYHFLVKPWEARELRQVVRRGLERFAAAAERVRLLEELRAACARAQREAEHKGRLLALTAHELGTPLHILLNAVALLREAERSPMAAHWLDAAERAVEWLTRGVVQMHDAARIGKRRFPVRPEVVPVAPLLAAAVAEVRRSAGGRVLEIAVEPGGAPLALRADPHWLRHALGGLLTNAVRFTPDGGRVHVAARPDGAWGEIAVTDNGVGIAPANLADAFEPFSAAGGNPLLHGSGRLAFGARGLGLGLAMVKGIAEAHRGSVRVESALGVGSCFTLRLPRADGPTAPSE
jgi:signal transduction histidine kinase